MRKIVMATRNRGKLSEFVKLMEDLPVEIIPVDAFAHIPEIEETGNTFEDNAALKAKTVAKLTGLMAVADDSGLEVDALNGAPGIYSARFAGAGATDAANNVKLLQLMKDVPAERRTARFRSVIAIALPDGECYFAQGVCEGLIAFESQGAEGFGYDPLFMVPSKKCTFAQLTLEEKNQISHRAMAFQEVKKLLNKLVASKNKQ